MNYTVYEAVPFGQFKLEATFEASDDRDALSKARAALPFGPGELRRGYTTICRFKRSSGRRNERSLHVAPSTSVA